MSPFHGFSSDSRSISVPNLLFSELLEQMEDLSELKLVLRIVALTNRNKGFPQTVKLDEVLADQILLRALGGVDEIRRAVRNGVERGVLLGGMIDGISILALHTDVNRSVLDGLREHGPVSEDQIPGVERQNIFALYEQNIGILTPLIAEELKDAEMVYPYGWIQDAFREAVDRNKRNWRYIETILKRWATEGKEDGKPGRYSQKITASEYIQRYGLPR